MDKSEGRRQKVVQIWNWNKDKSTFLNGTDQLIAKIINEYTHRLT